MLVNLSIPGYKTEFELNTLVNICATLPPNARIADVGCGWGREGWVFSKCMPDAHIVCIDHFKWGVSPFVHDGPEGLKNTLDEFNHYMQSCTNVETVVADFETYLPTVDRFDVIFLDAEDDNEEHIRRQFHVCLRALKHGGVLMGHDYGGPRKGVMEDTLNALAQEYAVTITNPEHTALWLMKF